MSKGLVIRAKLKIHLPSRLLNLEALEHIENQAKEINRLQRYYDRMKFGSELHEDVFKWHEDAHNYSLGRPQGWPNSVSEEDSSSI